MFLLSGCGQFSPVDTNLDDESFASLSTTSVYSADNFGPQGPQVCDQGTVCLGDKVLKFKSESGENLEAEVRATFENSVIIALQSSSGRYTFLRVSLRNDNLKVAPLPGWRSQLCFSHEQATCSAVKMPAGNFDNNCTDGIHWSGSDYGNTYAQKDYCPARN